MSPAFVCTICGVSNQPQATYCQSCGSSLQTSQPTTTYHPQTKQLIANVFLKQRYRIIGLVGSGGMGAVYKAEDTQLGNRLVALKEMRQSGMNAQELQQAVDAFRQEATMLARLQHPNLPSIFDHFEENGRWYLVMSFLEGETLKDYLRRKGNGKLLLDEALQIGIQLCTVLSYLHLQQPAPIIFRDLKPANIMRTPDGHIYLIDFGIARHFKPDQTRDTAYYASTGYAPPEQYGQAQTTPRSDIYSLGAILHQMLSGHNPSTIPFRFPSLLSQFPPIPTGLATLISQMLDLDEQKRPANVLAVRQILQDLVTAPALLAPPPPPPVAAGRPLPGYQPVLVAGSPLSYTPVLPSRRPRKKVGCIVLLVSIVGIIIAVSGLIFYLFSSYGNIVSSYPHLTSSSYQGDTLYPHLASSYQGSMQNTTLDERATLTLTITQQSQQEISGRMMLGPGLTGSGPFTGTVIGYSITFTVTSDDGLTITSLTGSITPQNTLSGTYSGYSTNGSAYQIGTWEARPSTT